MHATADAVLNNLLENNEVYLYTFGQSRVGNHAFLHMWISKIDGYYRLLHNEDVVPHVPSCITDFNKGCHNDGILPIYPLHSPQEIWYEKGFHSFTE
jgi:predicted lipase